MLFFVFLHCGRFKAKQNKKKDKLVLLIIFLCTFSFGGRSTKAGPRTTETKSLNYFALLPYEIEVIVFDLNFQILFYIVSLDVVL